jgi:hypothetical protein
VFQEPPVVVVGTWNGLTDLLASRNINSRRSKTMKDYEKLVKELKEFQELAELNSALEFYDYDEREDIWFVLSEEEWTRLRPLNFE